MAKSTASRRSKKPEKPYPDFPLFPHATKRWAKKIRGKFVYFGSWADGPEAALKKYLAVKDRLFAGLDAVEPTEATGYTVGKLCNEYLTSKTKELRLGIIRARHFKDLHKCCQRLVDHFGHRRLVNTIGPSDFQQLQFSFPDTWALRKTGHEIVLIRSVFRYAVEQDKITHVKFGGFKSPKKQAITTQSKRNGSRVFLPEQLRMILDNADPVLRAMVLLGVNCGYGNSDIAALTKAYIDLEKGWATLARSKTGQDRRAKLWPETLAALRQVMPRTGDLAFVRANGQPWVRVIQEQDANGQISISVVDEITKAFHRLLKELGIYRKGLSFYSLRHCTETFGGADQIATDLVMGHVTPGMSTNYRHGLDDARLEAVADSLHDWLWPKEPTVLSLKVS